MDVVGAAAGDFQPRFPVPPQVIHNTLPMPRGDYFPSLPNLVSRLRRKESADLELTATALEKAACLATHVNDNWDNPPFWKDSKRASMLIGPLAHFLLSLPRLPVALPGGTLPPEVVLREMVRLALLIILARLKPAFNLVSHEMENLQEQFSRLVASGIYGDFPEVRLWALIAVASLGEARSRQRYLPEIYPLIDSLTLVTGETAIENAKAIFWIDKLMDSDIEGLSTETNNYARPSVITNKAELPRVGTGASDLP